MRCYPCNRGLKATVKVSLSLRYAGLVTLNGCSQLTAYGSLQEALSLETHTLDILPIPYNIGPVYKDMFYNLGLGRRGFERRGIDDRVGVKNG